MTDEEIEAAAYKLCELRNWDAEATAWEGYEPKTSYLECAIFEIKEWLEVQEAVSLQKQEIK